jgi:PAT family beta-lactamase induction signal transducer AmpG
MHSVPASQRTPWAWIPTLYFAQGIPYVVVMTMAVILYKRLGISNTDIALYTSWLYLPWVIKPLWSPVVEMFGTKRGWVLTMQLLIGAALGCVALSLPGPAFFKLTLGCFWLLAFSSATNDIAADGFYMLALDKHQQAWFVGVRSTFYRLAMIAGQGLLIMLAGAIETRTGLAALDLKLIANPGAAAVAFPDPAAIAPVTAEPGPLRLQASPSPLLLNTTSRTSGEVKDLLLRSRQWNQSQGFTPKPENFAQPAAGANARPPSWWQGRVAKPLGAFLREHFGPKSAATNRADVAGSVGAFLLTLSSAPERDVVVNVSRVSGDKGIKLLEGERFTFNRTNWHRPMLVVVQLDPKAAQATGAVFRASAGNLPLAWAITFYTLAGLFLVLFAYHRCVLPRPIADAPAASRPRRNPLKEFFGTFGSFFRKPLILRSLAFLLLYRLAEAQAVKMVSLFLLDAREAGGLGLSTSAVGFVYGTMGVAALTLGGLLGGFCAARQGLKFWLPFMVCAIHLPNLAFLYLAYALPDNLAIITACIAVEQFGYGFGFAAYMIYMLYLAQGEQQTAHYAICTGFMALGMMIPGMLTGWLQETIGYQHFFVWIMICTLPGFLVTALIRPDPEFGKKPRGEGGVNPAAAGKR